MNALISGEKKFKTKLKSSVSYLEKKAHKPILQQKTAIDAGQKIKHNYLRALEIEQKQTNCGRESKLGLSNRHGSSLRAATAGAGSV